MRKRPASPALDRLDKRIVKAVRQARREGVDDRDIINILTGHVREGVFTAGGDLNTLAAAFEKLAAESRVLAREAMGGLH